MDGETGGLGEVVKCCSKVQTVFCLTPKPHYCLLGCYLNFNRENKLAPERFKFYSTVFSPLLTSSVWSWAGYIILQDLISLLCEMNVLVSIILEVLSSSSLRSRWSISENWNYCFLWATISLNMRYTRGQ